MPEERTPVLVVGAGLTGLSSAVFLAWHGVPCIVVERHRDPLIHPRLRAVLPRTVELFRQVGLEPAIQAAASTDGGRSAWTPVSAETLASENHIAIEEGSEGGTLVDASPCRLAAIDQDQLEVLLRDRARQLGGQVRFSTELASFEQNADGVDAVLTDRRSGAQHAVHANYLIAADGDVSCVRRQVGVEVDGPGPLSHQVTAVVEADLRPALRGRHVSIAYLQRPQPFTVLLAHDSEGLRWAFGTRFSPEQESIDDYDDDRIADMIRAAAGLPDVDVTLLPQIPGTNRKVLGFTIGAQVARRYRAGRVFLVGDAAHVVPPTGGLGGNTGIQDTHNLAWKLAADLGGQAGPSLLDTYHTERHPIGTFTMRQALARFAARMGHAGTAEPLVDYAAVGYGYQYRSAAVIGADDDTRPLMPSGLTGQPGTRAPHVTVVQDGAACSTIDLYGQRFVLLVGSHGEPWTQAADHVARAVAVPLDVYRFGIELTGDDPAAAHGIGCQGALLVRPDGFVAWRSTDAVVEPAATLERALRSVLGKASS
jgi:putative polyketide hydroxylase